MGSDSARRILGPDTDTLAESAAIVRAHTLEGGTKMDTYTSADSYSQSDSDNDTGTNQYENGDYDTDSDSHNYPYAY